MSKQQLDDRGASFGEPGALGDGKGLVIQRAGHFVRWHIDHRTEVFGLAYLVLFASGCGGMWSSALSFSPTGFVLCCAEWLGRRTHRSVVPGAFFGTDRLVIGRNTSIRHGFYVAGNESIEIGEDNFIAPQVMILTSEHAVRADGTVTEGALSKPVRIGDGCLIGTRVVILPGVTIGDGVVIAPGAVVSEDCESYSSTKVTRPGGSGGLVRLGRRAGHLTWAAASHRPASAPSGLSHCRSRRVAAKGAAGWAGGDHRGDRQQVARECHYWDDSSARSTPVSASSWVDRSSWNEPVRRWDRTHPRR